MLSILLSLPNVHADDSVMDSTVLPEEHATEEVVLADEVEAYLADLRERSIELEHLAEVAEEIAETTGTLTAYTDEIRYEAFGDLVNDPWNSRLLVWISGERFEMAAEDSDGDGAPDLLFDEDGDGFLRWYLPELSGTGQCLSTTTGVADTVSQAPGDSMVPLGADDFVDDTSTELYDEVDLHDLGLDFVVESESSESYNGGLDKLASEFQSAGYVVEFVGDGWAVSVLSCLSVADCERCETRPEAWSPTAQNHEVCPCVDTAEGSWTVSVGTEGGGEGGGKLEPTTGAGSNKLGSISVNVGGGVTINVGYSTNGNQPEACNPMLTPFTRLTYVEDPPDYSGGADDTVDEEEEEEDDRLGVDEKDDTVVQGGNGSDDDGLDDGEEEDGDDDQAPTE